MLERPPTFKVPMGKEWFASLLCWYFPENEWALASCWDLIAFPFWIFVRRLRRILENCQTDATKTWIWMHTTCCCIKPMTRLFAVDLGQVCLLCAQWLVFCCPVKVHRFDGHLRKLRKKPILACSAWWCGKWSWSTTCTQGIGLLCFCDFVQSLDPQLLLVSTTIMSSHFPRVAAT